MKRPTRLESKAEAEHHGRETTVCVSANAEDRMGGEEEEEEAALGDSGGGSVALGEKKRRLGVHQVTALEKNFEVENKLEPERKVKLARELGLQPRQVAVWFQNRRARWKTKQLERDYGVLKAEYGSLKLVHQTLRRDNEALLVQIEELKAKVGGDETVKDGYLDLTQKHQQDGEEEEEEESLLPALIYKDGSSDSDTSAILNEDRGSGISSSASGIIATHNLRQQQQHPVVSMDTEDCANRDGRGGYSYYQYNPQHVDEHEEHDLLNGSSSIFSDEEPPTLSWYYLN